MRMQVQKLMSRDLATVRVSETLDRAARLMKERDCGCVAVLGESGGLVGVVTDRDVCLAALRADAPLSQLRTGDAMSQPVFTCAPHDTIAEAERRMGQHQVRRLPVVGADGRLCGLLSLDDIAREAFREHDLIHPPVSTHAVGLTLGQIGRPHLARPPL